ncbi:MAG: hypothetical protein AAFY98_07770, partial [Verrucomicrobiota bacterium]
MKDEGYLSLNSSVASWWKYDPSVKCRCYSHLFIHLGNSVLIDPIKPPDPKLWKQLIDQGQLTLIILTSGNHQRQALEIQKEFNLPIACTVGAIKDLKITPQVVLDQQTRIHGLEVIPIHGAGPGEICLFSKEHQTIFIGDFIVNLPDRKLELLPEKYCQDP